MSTQEAKQFSGSTTISEILSTYGKITDDNAKRKIVLAFEVTSTKAEVAAGASVSKADTEKALATLSDLEAAAVAKYLAAAANFAKARVVGMTSDRWKSVILCNKVAMA